MGYKTAWVLSRKLRKLREAVAAGRADLTLDGTVEMDGMHIGGHVRPANRRGNRDDAHRRYVLALRQRQGRILATVVPGGHAIPRGIV